MSKEKSDHTYPARREFLRHSLGLIPVAAIAATGVGSAILAQPETAVAAPAKSKSFTPSYFTAEELAFVSAAVARLIPTDNLGPGAAESGVPEFIDRQLNTRYGSGGLWYMQGPFQPDAPKELGYQLKLSPQEVYRLGIEEANAYCQKQWGKPFAELDAAKQEQALQDFDSGKAAFEAVPAATFFAMLWSNTCEGFFSDPIHGGNQELAGWKLIGFPGARADFMDWVERDERYAFPPVSISGERG